MVEEWKEWKEWKEWNRSGDNQELVSRVGSKLGFWYNVVKVSFVKVT